MTARVFRLRLASRITLFTTAVALAGFGLALLGLDGDLGLKLAASAFLLLLAGLVALPAWRQQVAIDAEQVVVTPGYGRVQRWPREAIAQACLQASRLEDVVGGEVLRLETQPGGRAPLLLELSVFSRDDQRELLARVEQLLGRAVQRVQL